MKGSVKTYSTTALAAVTFAVLGACNPDRTDETAGDVVDRTEAAVDTTAERTGDVLDTAAGAVTPTTGDLATAAPATADQILGHVNASNAAEVKAGTLAQQKAQSPEVKAFAEQMVTDHKAMEEKSRSFAQKLNVTPTISDSALVEDQQEAIADLEEKTGADFDKAYIEQQIAAHEKTLEIIDEGIKAAANPKLNDMLLEARPKVEAHLQKAKQLQQQLSS